MRRAAIGAAGAVRRVACARRTQRQNLVSAASLDEVWRRHIRRQRCNCSTMFHVKHGPWLDLGSGAGFPGLVVAALRPDVRVVLVESRKRASRMAGRVRRSDSGLEQCRSDRRAARNVSRASRRRHFRPRLRSARPTARTFRPLFHTATRLWLLPKGRSAAQELAELPRAGQHMFHVEQSLTDPERGIIVGT